VENEKKNVVEVEGLREKITNLEAGIKNAHAAERRARANAGTGRMQINDLDNRLEQVGNILYDIAGLTARKNGGVGQQVHVLAQNGLRIARVVRV